MSKSFSISERLISFKYAWNGLNTFLVQEHNSRIHLLAAFVANGAGFYFQISALEWIAIWICIGMVLITEIINTSIETLCNYVSPQKNELIGKTKDLAAAAVLISAFISVIVAFLVFLK